MSSLENLIMWAVTSVAAGVASFLNKVLNDEDIDFNFWKMAMRGFIGLVVGVTIAWIANEQLGPEWGVPAASFGAWFSSESMMMLQGVVNKRLSND